MEAFPLYSEVRVCYGLSISVAALKSCSYFAPCWHTGPVRDCGRPLQVDWGGAGRHQTQQGCVEQGICQVRRTIRGESIDFFLPSIDIFGLWLITDAFHSGSSVSCSQYCMGNSFYSCNDVFCHHYSAVQVDVFTVVYKKFDSLVSGEWKFPRPAVLTRETSL